MARAAGSMALRPEVRIPRMRGAPAEFQTESHHPLVRADDAEGGRLTDDRAPRQPRRVGVALSEAPGAEGADLFVVGEEQHQGPAESRRVERGQAVGRQREKALHVGGAAPDVAVAGLGQYERVRSPVGLFGRHHVHVPREHQPVTFPRLRARRDDQVGLGAVGGAVPHYAHARPVEVVAKEVGQREVARAAGGVERDEPREQRSVVERGLRRCQGAGSVASRASRARTSRTPGWSAGSAFRHRSTKRR